MKKHCPLIFIVTLSGLTLPAIAETFSYTYVSAEYSRFSSALDGYSEDFEGNKYSIDVSIRLLRNLAAEAGYSRSSASVNMSGATADADITSTSLGVVAHTAVNDTTDFIIGMNFFNGKADVDVNGSYIGRIDADGGSAKLGIRKMMFDTLELNGYIYKRTIEDTTNIGLDVSAAYYFNKTVSLDLGYSSDDDSEVFALALTKYF